MWDLGAHCDLFINSAICTMLDLGDHLDTTTPDNDMSDQPTSFFQLAIVRLVTSKADGFYHGLCYMLWKKVPDLAIFVRARPLCQNNST